VPDLFTSVTGLFKPVAAAALQAAPDAKLVAAQADLTTQLSMIYKLDRDLKAYLLLKLNSPDCNGLSGFDEERKAIIQDIISTFKITGPRLNFNETYVTDKNQIISITKTTDPTYSTDKFNTDYQKTYRMSISPDSLIRETSGLIGTLQTTEFQFQYNVPQLQNADKIVFTLNIKPKTGTNGSIYTTSSSLELPIRYGWKIDFSTGFFYTNISSTKYGFLDNTDHATNTVTSRSVVSENGSGKGTVGIDALMHVYPRLGHLQPSLVLGVGSGTDFNYSLLTGLGAVIGKENRLALSTGISFNNVSTLSSRYFDNNGNKVNVAATETKITDVTHENS